MKWNSSGTNLLFLTQTEVDKTGKSYYGETNLYMMSAAGTFDCRVTLGMSAPSSLVLTVQTRRAASRTLRGLPTTRSSLSRTATCPRRRSSSTSG